MTEEKEPAEAVAAAAEAIEKLVENDKTNNQTPSVGPFSGHKLRSLAALILAGTSLLATLGTFLKTCDHSVSENSYNALSESITKLSDEQRRNHDDLMALHGYLAGLTRVPLTEDVDAGLAVISTAVPSTSASTAVAPLVTTKDAGLRPLVRPTIVGRTPNDGGLITFAIQAPPLPSVHPPPSPVKPPPFTAIMAE